MQILVPLLLAVSPQPGPPARGVLAKMTPQMIEEIVRGFPAVEEFFSTDETRHGLDSLRIKIEVKPDTDGAAAERVVGEIKQQVKKNIGLSPEISLEPRDSLPRFELKARRFRDLRAKS